MAGAPLNAEQAVSAAEKLAHWVRDLREIEPLTLWLRGALKDIPEYEARITALQAEEAAAKKATTQATVSLENERAAHQAWKKDTSAERTALANEVAVERQRLLASVKPMQEAEAATQARIEKLRGEAATLASTVAQYERQVAELRRDTALVGKAKDELQAGLDALKKAHGLA